VPFGTERHAQADQGISGLLVRALGTELSVQRFKSDETVAFAVDFQSPFQALQIIMWELPNIGTTIIVLDCGMNFRFGQSLDFNFAVKCLAEIEGSRKRKRFNSVKCSQELCPREGKRFVVHENDEEKALTSFQTEPQPNGKARLKFASGSN